MIGSIAIINVTVYNDMPMFPMDGREEDFVGSLSCSVIEFDHRTKGEGKRNSKTHSMDVFVRLIEFVAIFS